MDGATDAPIDIAEFRDLLAQALSTGSESGLHSAFGRLSWDILYDAGKLPDEYFAVIEAMLASDDALRSTVTWKFLSRVHGVRHYLTAEQKSRLGRACEALFWASTEWMTWFCIGHLILGECIKDREALAIAQRLRARADADRRSALPAAFESLYRELGDLALREDALAALRAMEKDDDEDVRDAVAHSYARLSSVGVEIDGVRSRQRRRGR